MFKQNNIQEGHSYQTLLKMGGTDALERQLLTSTTHGIDPTSVDERTKA